MSRILSIGISFLFFFLIIELTKRKKLKEQYALLWLIIGVMIFIFAVFDKMLFGIANFLGIKTPINAMIFFGIFYILLINLHFSLVISNLSEQVKKLAQKLALFEQKIPDKR